MTPDRHLKELDYYRDDIMYKMKRGNNLAFMFTMSLFLAKIGITVVSQHQIGSATNNVFISKPIGLIHHACCI